MSMGMGRGRLCLRTIDGAHFGGGLAGLSMPLISKGGYFDLSLALKTKIILDARSHQRYSAIRVSVGGLEDW